MTLFLCCFCCSRVCSNPVIKLSGRVLPRRRALCVVTQTEHHVCLKMARQSEKPNPVLSIQPLRLGMLQEAPLIRIGLVSLGVKFSGSALFGRVRKA
ncbi:hypothetical protein E2C01_067994 [Portunus trituberculatus]|uniref:Secreted protein n=1 Tax=Portunus trituberculatus TaxID=210409 RepID=A0A5B7HYA6_PORTR|nr:hypothetical protein [Portunus trituberculatus]